ncbi:hypothetical protein [Natrarchaeobaculum sulfurireducens]|uniref:hypothetical protein n=1 Tax=Natrarchaeobaculum sulfurireducens TaxID=2044521 RepID=UPI001643031D|nr:hypothetical protein [Natrarchaeobaculum sulfurireducens]
MSAISEQGDNVISDDDLRDVDRALLGYLEKGPITPAYARKQLEKDDVGEYTRGYVQQRLSWLEEHGHVENLLDTGLYSVVDDPRTDADDIDPEDRIMVLEQQLEAAIADRDEAERKLGNARTRAEDLARRVETAEDIDRDAIEDAHDYLEIAIDELPDDVAGRMSVEDAYHTLSSVLEN